jgi:Ca2+-binding RTX toxin-like protein
MNQNNRITQALGLAAMATMTVALVGTPTAYAAAPPRSSASVAGGVLSIAGSNAGDTIAVDFRSPDSVAVDLDGVRQSFTRDGLSSVSVLLGNGDDAFSTVTGGSAATDLPLDVAGGNGRDSVTGGANVDFIFGENGDDRLLGGAGTDVLSGDRGNDFVNGQVGADTELLGSGDDTAGWLPGEGSDAIVGDSGADTLAFTGAGGDEVMSLSPNGSSAVFLRSPGAIRMDLDGVERLAVTTLGGVDAVTVDDLTGTDLVEASIDLSAGGIGDLKDDTVTVNGTDGADNIAVGARAGGIDVSGLRTRTVITGNEPTDRLNINARDGADRVDVTDAAQSLIAVLVDLGAGQ